MNVANCCEEELTRSWNRAGHWHLSILLKLPLSLTSVGVRLDAVEAQWCAPLLSDGRLGSQRHKHASEPDASCVDLQLRQLLSHPDASVRARVCNLVGNLCRHSAYFCEALREAHVLAPLIARCGDNDRATRKFACFAIGNAGDASNFLAAGHVAAAAVAHH